MWSSQYRFGGKGCDIWQKSYPDNNLTLEMPDILSKAALLTDVLTDVPGLQKSKGEESATNQGCYPSSEATSTALQLTLPATS